MAKGRASPLLPIVLVGIIAVLHFKVAEAATYTVGGLDGWIFNISGWPQGKSFNAGDVLVFNYDPAFHNVVSVNQAGYSSCTTPRGAKVYTSGKDSIKLVKGQNFSICNFASHCKSGMKIAINAI